jgi:hypothetical protein
VGTPQAGNPLQPKQLGPQLPKRRKAGAPPAPVQV